MSEKNTQVLNQNEKSDFYSKKFKKAALEQLKGRWTVPVLVSLVCSVITVALFCFMFPFGFYINTIKSGGIPDMSTFPYVRYILGLILLIFCSPIISLAQLSIFPVLYNSKEPVKFADFISGFALWGKAICSLLWQSLWLWLWEMLGMVIGVAFGLLVGGIAYAITKDSMIMSACIPVCIYIPVIIILIIKSYEYSLMDYAIVDNNDVKVTQALNISKELTKGYKWKLFCLDFSFIGWGLLTCIFPIGILWLENYQYAAKFTAYRFILDKFNQMMTEKLAAAKPMAIEDEPVSAEVDTSDGNEC